MKYIIEKNPEFDFFVGYLGGFDDIPTKQDKFKPITYHTVLGYDEEGNETKIEGELYIGNPKKRAGQKKFEEYFIDLVKSNLGEEHPYKNPLQLEVIISIKMSEKRLKEVDIDNLIKSILDCMNGLVYEDDNQVRSVFASKYVIIDGFVPQVSGVQVGVRKLDVRESWLAGVEMYTIREYDKEVEKEDNRDKEIVDL